MSSRSWRFTLLLCICANFVPSEARRENGENHDIDSSRSLAAYAIASKADILNSTTCRKELTDFRYAIDERILWALKMLDASGRPRAGFIYGNNLWLGSRSQCLDTMNPSPLQLAEREIANNTLYRDPRQESPPFGINYFVAHFRHNSTLQYHVKVRKFEDLVTLGLCLPLSCSTKELGFILEKIFRDRVLLVGDLYSADFRLVAVRDLRDDHRWLLNGATLFIRSILAFTWFLMITGTIYDVYQRYLKAQNRLSAYPLRRITSSQKAPLSCESDAKNESENTEATVSSRLRTGRIAQVLMCFSVYTNTRIIFSIKNATSISSIHGLRSISMIWIIIVHSLYYSADYFDNMPLALRISESFIAQILSNSTLSVDTYFCMSGFLLTHIYLNIHGADEKRTGAIDYGAKLKEFFVFLLRRFMRLTPAYAITIGIVYLSASWYSRTSQFYMSERLHEVCAKYWWRNLLYINNFFSFDTMCMSWSWYLSNDTQFFVIGLIVMILSSVCFHAAVMLFTLLIGTIVLSGYLSYVNGYVPTLDEQYRLLDVLYYRPWTRIGPYIIGMIAAYVVFEVKNNGLVLRRKTVIFFWCLGSACIIFTLFGTYKRHISVLAAAFYVALSRTCWAVGVAWILIACSTKHGGILNKFLSFRGWVPLSRLTYCAYLMNPLVINSFRLDSESSTHVDIMPLVVTFFGYWTLSYVYAYGLSLMSEVPYVQLLKQLQPGSTSQQKRMRRTKEIIMTRKE